MKPYPCLKLSKLILESFRDKFLEVLFGGETFRVGETSIFVTFVTIVALNSSRFSPAWIDKLLTATPEPVRIPMMPCSLLPRFWMRRFGFALMLPAALVSAIAFTTPWQSATGQTPKDGRALTINSDVQEANSQTGVFTARGNVQIAYPARQIQATAAQVQYFTRERRMILSGDVYILQQGNSIRGDTVTYLIDEGRFIATPKTNGQVEAIYIVPETNPSTQPSAAPATPPFNARPDSQTPLGAPAAPEP